MTQEEKREKALADVKLYMANDWEIKEETPQFFILERKKAKMWVHIIMLLFGSWIILGIPNFIYHKMSKEKKKIVI